MTLWSKQGVIGKLHNLIWFIRASPQREALFLDIAEHFLSAADEIDSHSRYLPVIDDNQTRWNLTYLTIHRVFCLRHRIEKFYTTCFNKDKDFPSLDILIEADYEKLAILKDLLDPLYRLSMQLQGNNKTGTHGAAWESLVGINIIKEHLKRAKTEYVRSRNSGFLLTTINTSLNLAKKYFKLISEPPVYFAALLLKPTQKWDYFESKWQHTKRKNQAEKYRKNLQNVWSRQYKKNTSLYLDNPEVRTPPAGLPFDILNEFLAPESNYPLDKKVEMDEIELYCHFFLLRAPHSSLVNWKQNTVSWAFSLDFWFVFNPSNVCRLWAGFFISWSTFDQTAKPVIGWYSRSKWMLTSLETSWNILASSATSNGCQGIVELGVWRWRFS